MTESEKIPGRRISEEALRSIASEISAGKTLVPESWPNLQSCNRSAPANPGRVEGWRGAP